MGLIYNIMAFLSVMMFLMGIYSWNKYHNNKTFKKNFSIFKIVLIFPLLDVMSTIMFVTKYGIEAEGNPWARYLMYTFNSHSFIIMFLIATLSLISFYGFIYFTYIKTKKLLDQKIYKILRIKFKGEQPEFRNVVIIVTWLFISIYMIILTVNISSLFV